METNFKSKPMLETLNSHKQILLPSSDAFETSNFKLWFQPVYQMKTGAVLHNEVLLRWQDDRGDLHLPEEFISSLTSPEALQQLDRTVIRQTVELMAQHPDRCFSVNLSGVGLDDPALIEFIQTTLQQSEVDPKQLSFELTELAIAKNFSAARRFICKLKELGCPIVLDDFACRELTLFQCQQLEVDLIKVNGQLIQRLKTDPSSRVLTWAILQGVQTLSKVTAKYVSDRVTLALVEEVNLDCVQGHYLKAPTPEPDWSAYQVSPSEATPQTAQATKPPSLSWRLLRGTGFVLLGLAAAAVGAASIGYRLMHVSVDDGVLNSRVVRVQATADGKLDAFYARPGVAVRSGQVLARISSELAPPPPPNEQALLQIKHSQADAQIRTQLDLSQLQGQLQVKTAQLTAAKETLVALNQQLLSLDSQDRAVREVNVQLASDTVSKEQATLEAALAKATAARSEYERYQQLVADGAVSQLQTEQARSAWESAEAEVEQARSLLRSAQTSLKASKNGVALDDQGDILDRRAKLLQTIQTQEGLVKTLEAQIASDRQQLDQTRSVRQNPPSITTPSKTPQAQTLVREVVAPFDGIVYRTERDRGEQVSKSESMLTLLDCNDLWVEAVVSADVANGIDAQKPVKVHLTNSSKTLLGEVDLIQPIAPNQDIAEQTKLRQAQALLPAVPPNLQGQLLALVTVRIPPAPEYTNSRQFCGLGQPTKLTFGKKGWEFSANR